VASATIAGRVTIDVNGTPQPVRRAKVTLASSGLPTEVKVDTDTDGRYRFDTLPEGSYRIQADKDGFVPRLRDPRRAFEKPSEFTIAAGQSLTIDLPMVRASALEGRITSDTGSPAINVVVSAMKFVYEDQGRRAVAVRQTRTDDLGRFRLHTLPAGQYYLDAAPDPLAVIRDAPVPGQPPRALMRTFYPGAPGIDSGQALTVPAGRDVSNLNFSRPLMPMATLKGSVLDSAGQPATTMFVRVQRVGGAVGEVRGMALPSSNEFTYRSVPAGDFWFMAVARPSPTADVEFAATRITVLGQDAVDVTLTTVKPAPVSGRITIESGASPRLETLQVVAHETEFELPSLLDAPVVVSPTPVASDGTFAFKGLFGPRLLRLGRLPAGWTLQRVSVDGADVTNVPVDFKGGATPRTVHMVITSRTSSISGVVRDQAGQPVSQARVVAFSADERTWGWRSLTVKSVESDADGRYLIEGLLDGHYHVVAVPFLEDGSWMDGTILRTLQPASAPLPVADATKLIVNVVVKP
jgi:hypothetical protein